MTKENILEIINSTLFTEVEKQNLLNKLEEEGLVESFYEEFNEILLIKFKEDLATYQKFVENYDQANLEIDEDYERRKKKIEENLEEELTKVDFNDTNSREKILTNYEEEIGLLRSEYENRLKDLYSKTYTALLQDKKF